MSTTEQIIKLKTLAVTAKTAIYNEEAMTALELAGVTACKVNQCIDAINTIIETIDVIATDIKNIGVKIEYDPKTEGVILK